MEQTIIEHRTSYTSAWLCLIFGFIFWPLWIVAIILFISKNKETIVITNIVSKDDNNANRNYNNENTINSISEHLDSIIAEHSETTISDQTDK